MVKITIKNLPEFDVWLNGLNDRTTRLRLSRRIDKAQRGYVEDFVIEARARIM